MSGAQPTTYHNDAEMEDTASSSVRFVGETIPESTDSSLGLRRSDVPAEQSGQGVTGPRTTETRSFGDADAGSTSGEQISNPGASDSQVTNDASRQQSVPAISSIRSRSRSPKGRALSPKRTQSTELRARFARLHQGRLFKYVPAI